MECIQAEGTASCVGGDQAAVEFPAPPIPGSTRTPSVNTPTATYCQDNACTTVHCPPVDATSVWICKTSSDPAARAAVATTSTAVQPASSTGQGVEQPGSYDHSTDAQFCSSHQCIENFPNGHGYIVQCTDGMWSHSGGISGACSDHGGES